MQNIFYHTAVSGTSSRSYAMEQSMGYFRVVCISRFRICTAQAMEFNVIMLAEKSTAYNIFL